MVMRVLGMLLMAAAGNAINVIHERPVLLGRSTESATHFWMPSGGTAFEEGQAAINVRLRGTHCYCPEDVSDLLTSTSEWERCAKPCDPRSLWYLTVDGGATFEPQNEAGDFCGPASIRLTDEEGAKVLRCVSQSSAEFRIDAAEFTTVEWKVTTGGVFNQAKLEGKKGTMKSVWNLGSFAKEQAPSAVTLGGNVLNVTEKKQLLRLATFTWTDGDTSESRTLLFKTVDLGSNMDLGATWTVVNATSSVVKEQSLLFRTGDKSLTVYGRDGPSTFVTLSATSLGKKWRRAQKLNISRIPSMVSTHFNILNGGAVRGAPRVYIPGQKKAKEQLLELSIEHDRLMPENPYGPPYLDAVSQGTFDGCDVPPFPDSAEKGCMSSGAVEIVQVGTDTEQNTTTYIACYDKLASGWGGPAPDQNDEVWCQRLVANETTEMTAYAKKLKRDEERRKADEEARIAAELAREERKKKEQEKRRMRVRLEKERRRLWARTDYAEALQPAFEQAKEDGELVVVREETLEWDDITKESVGLPDRYYQPPEPEPEVAPEDENQAETAEVKNETSDGQDEA